MPSTRHSDSGSRSMVCGTIANLNFAHLFERDTNDFSIMMMISNNVEQTFEKIRNKKIVNAARMANKSLFSLP